MFVVYWVIPLYSRDWHNVFNQVYLNKTNWLINLKLRKLKNQVGIKASLLEMFISVKKLK